MYFQQIDEKFRSFDVNVVKKKALLLKPKDGSRVSPGDRKLELISVATSILATIYGLRKLF